MIQNSRIIFPNSENGVSIVIPAPNYEGSIQQLAAQVVPANTPYEIVDAADIPSDRTFRNAWSFTPSEATLTNSGE